MCDEEIFLCPQNTTDRSTFTHVGNLMCIVKSDAVILLVVTQFKNITQQKDFKLYNFVPLKLCHTHSETCAKETTIFNQSIYRI